MASIRSPSVSSSKNFSACLHLGDITVFALFTYSPNRCIKTSFDYDKLSENIFKRLIMFNQENYNQRKITCNFLKKILLIFLFLFYNFIMNISEELQFNKIKDYFQLINNLYHIHISIQDKGRKVLILGKSIDIDQMRSLEYDVDECCIQKYNQLSIHIHPHGLLWAIIKDRYSYSIGPILLNDIHPAIASTKKAYAVYPMMSIHECINLIQLIYYEILNYSLTTSSIKIEESIRLLFMTPLSNNITDNIFNSPSKQNKYLLYVMSAIQRGDVKEYTKSIHQWFNDQANLSSYDYYSSLLFALSVFSTSATQGHLSPEKSYALYTYYLQYITSIHDFSNYQYIIEKIGKDFALAVSQEETSSYSSYVRDACFYIDNNLNKKLKIDDVANSINISSSYLRTIFLKEVGTTIQKYIERKKIETACFMLSFTQFSIIYISNYLGYTQSYLGSLFQKHYHLTPNQFRHQSQSDTDKNNHI